MAKTKFEKDHGLDVRMFITGLALVVLYAIIVYVLLRVGVAFGFVIVIGAALLFSQYYFSAKIAMFAMHAHEVTPQQEPRLHQIVDRLCTLADMPKPKVGVSEMDMPNAFATGRNPKAAVVCATRGLMTRLNDEELEAVLAHELSHVAHRDVAVMTIASGVGMLAGLVGRMAMWGAMLSGGGRGRNGQNIVLLELATMLISVVIYVIAFMLTMALSRYRELAADRSGAILIGKPSVLASALVHVTGDMGKIPRTDLRKAEGMNAFFFAPALAGRTAASLFSTHPSLEVRLDQLNKLEKETERLVGLRDTLFGRTKQVPPKLDNLFALPTAALTLRERTGPGPLGPGGLCFKAGSGEATLTTDADINELLDFDQADDKVSLTTDDLGFKWLVIKDPDLESLVTRIHGANTSMVEHGLGAAAAVRGVRLRARRPRRARARSAWSTS